MGQQCNDNVTTMQQQCNKVMNKERNKERNKLRNNERKEGINKQPNKQTHKNRIKNLKFVKEYENGRCCNKATSTNH